MFPISKKNSYSIKKEKIGIIQVDTQFKRILGDIGNPATWPFPVLYQIMRDISPRKVIFKNDTPVLQAALQAALSLEEKGVNAITTTCGFLARYQKELSDAVKVPVLTSSLLQIQLIDRMMNRKKRIAVLTAKKSALNQLHFQAVGARDIPVICYGMDEKAYFQKVFVNNLLSDFKPCIIERELLALTRELMEKHPETGAILLECTNMSPYIKSIQAQAQVPVFDILTLIQWFYHGVCPQKGKCHYY